ncbi:uncharacterized protein LOC125655327 isoform X2 [Ostrea edulis]|uniref:uncharacterized protein LOC125655327 isoform X2 n=1 Tax=Ostrea edulis TaxID=37623 RepID=UPI0024AF5850|nr:uncharacterized protein LOC125655327 isoform X2 [Ostrea edulis]
MMVTSFGTWLPFRRSQPCGIKHISKEVVDASCPVQLYVVGRDGILIPVNTHLGSSTENYSQPSDSDPNNHMITKLHESTVQLMDRPPLVQTNESESDDTIPSTG